MFHNYKRLSYAKMFGGSLLDFPVTRFVALTIVTSDIRSAIVDVSTRFECLPCNQVADTVSVQSKKKPTNNFA